MHIGSSIPGAEHRFDHRVLRRQTWSIEHWAFFAFFPGYILYQTLIVQGYGAPIFGGLSTPTALVFILPLAIAFAWRLSRGSLILGHMDYLYFLFIGGFMLVAVIGYIEFTSLTSPAVHLATIVQMIAYYLCIRLIDFTSKYSKITFTLSFAVSILTVFVFRDEGLTYTPNVQMDEIFYRDYQGYAMALIISTFCLLATTRYFRFRLFIYIAALASLFVNGARSEFIAIVPALMLNEVLVSNNKSIGLVALGIAAAIFVAAIPYLENFGEAERITKLLADYQGDASYVERVWSITNAVATIREHPLLGDYLSYPEGLYAHNLLSAWVDLGLLGFLIYVTLLVGPPYLVWRHRHLLGASSAIAAAMLGLTLLLLALGAKAYTYKLIGPAVAMSCAIALHRRPAGLQDIP